MLFELNQHKNRIHFNERGTPQFGIKLSGVKKQPLSGLSIFINARLSELIKSYSKIGLLGGL
jgi:hypothetical protein